MKYFILIMKEVSFFNLTTIKIPSFSSSFQDIGDKIEKHSMFWY